MKLSEITIIPLLDTLKFEDIDDGIYFSKKYKDYVSNSRLSRINPEQGGSPEKFFNESLNLYTDSIIFGSAMHTLVLQPESFELIEFVNRPTAKAGFMADELYNIYKINQSITDNDIYKASDKIGYYKDKLTKTKIDNLLNQCKPYWESRYKFESKNTSTKIPIYLSEKYREKLLKCIEAVSRNESFQALLNPKGLVQEPVYGYEKAILMDVKVECKDVEPFVLKLKSKLDNFTIDKDLNIIYVNDLKTHGAIIPEFNNALLKYHYYREMAMYSWLLSLVATKFYGLKDPTIKSNFLVAQTIPEFYTKVFPMNKELFMKGFKEFKYLLKLVAFYKIKGYDF